MSLKARLFTALVLPLALLAAPGCGLGPDKPSSVARGEYYSSGKPSYDAFFIALFQFQVDLLNAPEQQAATRRGLTQAAGLNPEASNDALQARLSQELKKQGLRLRLEIPEPSNQLDASATLHSSDGARSCARCDGLARDATQLVRSRNRMLATKQELEGLRVSGIELGGNIDQAFRLDGPWKRDEVRQNLDDGQKMITLMLARAQNVREGDEKLLALLVSAVTSDPNLGKAAANGAPSDEPDSSKPTKRPAPRSTSKAPAAPAPIKAAVAAKPAARPSGGDDDAPTPKPVQGNAPAEIEP